jgi:hypothetical protein
MQFYDVGTKSFFNAKKDDIRVKIMKGTRQPALRTIAPSGEYYIYKFIKIADYDKMVDKFGKTR